MNISGILVVTAPEHTSEVIDRLHGLNGIDVHYVDEPTGRIVITQEAESIRSEVDGLRRIQTLPGVIMAEMSYHNFEEDRELIGAIPGDLEEYDLDAARVPDRLND